MAEEKPILVDDEWYSVDEMVQLFIKTREELQETEDKLADLLDEYTEVMQWRKEVFSSLITRIFQMECPVNEPSHPSWDHWLELKALAGELT